MLSATAPAKINLFLHITGQREDGYHTLQTVFQILDFGDEMHFEASNDSALTLTSNYSEVATHDNLVIKAAKALQQHTGCSQGAKITLNKRIPSGAGLGGGSSDAATSLLALNKLWGTHLALHELATIGAQLGADVPVFIHGKNAWAEGIGEKLTPVSLPKPYYLVVFPACSVPTATIFRDKHLTRDSSPITLAAFLEGGGHNDCESVVRQLYPDVDKALNLLANYGQFRMTGTGSSLYCQMSSKNEAEAIKKALPQHWQSFVTKGVELSPSHQQLGITHGN